MTMFTQVFLYCRWIECRLGRLYGTVMDPLYSSQTCVIQLLKPIRHRSEPPQSYKAGPRQVQASSVGVMYCSSGPNTGSNSGGGRILKKTKQKVEKVFHQVRFTHFSIMFIKQMCPLWGLERTDGMGFFYGLNILYSFLCIKTLYVDKGPLQNNLSYPLTLQTSGNIGQTFDLAKAWLKA